MANELAVQDWELAEPDKPRGKAAAGLFDDFAIDSLYRLLTAAPDPDLLLRQRGINRAGLRVLETDDEITAALDTRRDAVIGTPWRLEPPPESPEENEPLEWTWAQLEAHMEPMLRCSWQAVPYGYSVGEMVWRPEENGRIGIERYAEKPQEWFAPRSDGALIWVGHQGLTAMQQNDVLDQRYKFFLTRRSPTYRQPYGEALLSRLYWAWYFRHNAWRFWMQFLERFGDPLILGQVASPGEFVAEIQRMGVSSVLGVAMDEKVEAVTQGSAGEFERIENALCRRVQKTILGQTMTTDAQAAGLGSNQANVQNEVRDDKRVSDMRLVRPTMQRIVDAIWTLNQFPGLPPRFILTDDRGLESARAVRDGTLKEKGIVSAFSQEYVDRVYDFEEGEALVGGALPVAGESEPPQEGVPLEVPGGTAVQDTALNGAQVSALLEIVGQVTSGAMEKASAKALIRAAFPSLDDAQVNAIIDPLTVDDTPAPEPPKPGEVPEQFAAELLAAARRADPHQALLDDVADVTIARAGAPADEAALRKAVMAAKDPADLKRRLSKLLGRGNKTFAAALKRGLVAAGVIGYLGAEDESPSEPKEDKAAVKLREREEALLAVLEKKVRDL